MDLEASTICTASQTKKRLPRLKGRLSEARQSRLAAQNNAERRLRLAEIPQRRLLQQRQGHHEPIKARPPATWRLRLPIQDLCHHLLQLSAIRLWASGMRPTEALHLLALDLN